MKLLTASLFSLVLCAGVSAQTTDPSGSETKPAEQSTTQPAKTDDVKVTPDAEAAAPVAKTEAEKTKELMQRAGYAFGLSIGMNIKAQDIDLDVNSLSAGLRDGIEGKTPKMDEAAIQLAMVELQKYVQGKQMERAKVIGERNKVEGAAFLAKNKTQAGVQTTASGLQYKVIKEGQGESPKANDFVSVHYVGTLLDGTEFDSSYARNQPANFPVSGVIAGWTEALQLMKPGAKFRLFIAPELAYGDQGAGADIGPNATLIFDVELLSVKPAGGEGGME